MDFLSTILNIVKPTGVWPTIIDAFENGLGSYLLAIVIITLILRVALSPFDVVNKRISKKQSAAQAKLQPELEALQKKYGHDKKLLNQKTSELYKKSGMSIGGSCLFMLVFMALNLTIFFTLFSSLNAISAYKISQEYSTLKDSYTNVLNITNSYYEENGNFDILNDYENLSFSVEKDGEETFFKALDKDGNLIYKTNYKTDLSSYKETENILPAGEITDKVVDFKQDNEYTKVKIVDGDKTDYYFIKTNAITKEENVYTISENQNLYNFISTNDKLEEYIYSYVRAEEVSEEETPKYTYIGDTIITGETKLSTALQSVAMSEVFKSYSNVQKENSFLWIGNIWVADSPFQNSVFDFNQYKGKVGVNNVEDKEEVVYNSFMVEVRQTKGRVNGYFILAIISIGISFLATWLGQRTQKSAPNSKTKWTMTIIMPLIMGVFAILYNGVFAIYLIVSQAIAAAIAPLSNFIVKKWEEHDKKKEEAKQTVVDYRRKW